MATLLLVGGGLLIYLAILRDTPPSPDPSKWRTSYPALCQRIKEGMRTPGTSPEEPILWSAVSLGSAEGQGWAVRFDLPDPESPEGRPVPIRFWYDRPEDGAVWQAVPAGTRVVFSAQWDGMFSYDIHTDPKHWKPYIILTKVKLVARQ
jgi:hypothetical protein